MDEYVQFFGAVVRPELERIDGFIDARVLATEASAGAAEVVVESRWRSMEAVGAFAGPEPSRAVVEPEAARMFVDYDRTVRHYRVMDE